MRRILRIGIGARAPALEGEIDCRCGFSKTAEVGKTSREPHADTGNTVRITRFTRELAAERRIQRKCLVARTDAEANDTPETGIPPDCGEFAEQGADRPVVVEQLTAVAIARFIAKTVEATVGYVAGQRTVTDVDKSRVVEDRPTHARSATTRTGSAWATAKATSSCGAEVVSAAGSGPRP